MGPYSKKLKTRMPTPGVLILSHRQRELSEAKYCDFLFRLTSSHCRRGHEGVHSGDPARGRRSLSTEGLQSSERGKSDIWTHSKKVSFQDVKLPVSA